jgi:hypothetical protein
MDRQQTKEHLALAEEHVALGATNVARQREIIAKLERDGHDATQARALLAQFEQLQATHVTDRDRLLSELERERPVEHPMP